MGKCHGAGPRSRDREKYLVADNGKTYSVSTILVCEQIGDRCCRAIVHRGGTVTFSGRAFDRMPPIKFNHCTSKFFNGGVRNGNHQLVAAAPGDAAGACGDEGTVTRGAAKPRRAAYFEQPVAAPRMAAATGGAPTDLAESAGAGDGSDAELLDVVGSGDARLDRGPCGGSGRVNTSGRGTDDGAGAPDMMMLDAKSGEEAEMSEKKNPHARRFNNEKHGKMLLEEVRVFMRQRGLVKMYGHWEEFDEYAANHKTLKHWNGEQGGWDTRHRAALRRWEGDGEQAEQVARVKELLKQNGMTLGKIYDAINPKKPSRAKEQLAMRLPWDPDSLRNLAQFFDVSEEYLRTGLVAAAAPPAPATTPVSDGVQQELPVPPWTAAAQSVGKVEVRDAPEQATQQAWDLVVALEVLDNLAKLAQAGKGVDNKALRSYLDLARARASITDITSALLAETSND